MRSNVEEIRKFVYGRLESWRRETNEHILRADMAKLRRGIGKRPGELPELWELLFDGMPEQLMSAYGDPTPAEWAVSGALTLYALHQQGAASGVSMHKSGQRLGIAMAQLAGGEDDDRLKAVQRRFNAFATAREMPECMHHLRGLVQLLRSQDISLDYVKLAEDLYYFQDQDKAANVRLAWGQDFYRNRFRTEEGKDENHE